MIDERDRELTLAECGWQLGRRAVFDPFRPTRGSARTLPAQEIAQAPARGGVRVLVTENLTIKMIRRRPLVTGSAAYRAAGCVGTRSESKKSSDWFAQNGRFEAGGLAAGGRFAAGKVFTQGKPDGLQQRAVVCHVGHPPVDRLCGAMEVHELKIGQVRP